MRQRICFQALTKPLARLGASFASSRKSRSICRMPKSAFAPPTSSRLGGRFFSIPLVLLVVATSGVDACQGVNRRGFETEVEIKPIGIMHTSACAFFFLQEEPVGNLITEEISEPSIPETMKRVVRSKYFTMDPMTVEEAMDNIQLVGHQFYVFLNKDSGNVNVLYERNHGGYGVIIPLMGSSNGKESSTNNNGAYESELKRYEDTE